MIIINFILIVFLIAFTAFFVSSEFAIVKVRSSRIDQLIAEGHPKVMAVRNVISNLDGYLSACQLGITITSLGLGWLGEPTVEAFLHPMFKKWDLDPAAANILSFAIAFSFITFLHVVVGELAPKTIAIQRAEEISILFAKPLIIFYKVMYPFIWILNNAARLMTGIFGFKPVTEHEIAHSEEELRIILSESYASGEINQSEFKYVNNIFEFDNRIAKEIMVPRLEMICFNQDATIEEILEIVREEGYTRYPVIDGDKDNILGMVNIKEILTDCLFNKCKGEQPLTPYLKPIIHVIETIPIHDLLVRLQKDRVHIAILLDEYGGTAGLVTVEDILEEIVGEIRDEFDMDEIPLVQKLPDHDQHYIFDAKILVSEVNDLLGTTLSEEEVDTLGGWFLTQRYEFTGNDTIEEQGYLFTIKEADGNHILYIEVEKL